MAQGAEGQIDVSAPFEAAEAPTGMACDPEGYDDRPMVNAGSQQHGELSPAHGAAGGMNIDFGTHGAPPAVSPMATARIGLTTNDPEFGTR